jgi:hypothetical protein
MRRATQNSISISGRLTAIDAEFLKPGQNFGPHVSVVSAHLRCRETLLFGQLPDLRTRQTQKLHQLERCHDNAVVGFGRQRRRTCFGHSRLFLVSAVTSHELPRAKCQLGICEIADIATQVKRGDVKLICTGRKRIYHIAGCRKCSWPRENPSRQTGSQELKKFVSVSTRDNWTLMKEVL